LLLTGAIRGAAQNVSSGNERNLAFPIDNLTRLLTPSELFFVRDHFHEPEISLSTWRLNIEGRVGMPLDLTFSDILESPTKKLDAVLECAGDPSTGSAVSNGNWEGVSIAYLLERAKADPDAVTVLFEGADSGKLFSEAPELPYCQVVPMGKCLQSESLLAFKLNGQYLARRGGFPARALFPGWYGMNSVKWLRRIVVLSPSDPVPNFQPSGMNRLYNRIVQTAAKDLEVTRLSQIQVRSIISWPPDETRLPLNHYLVRGFAWTGEALIRSVSFSWDGGHTWAPAQFEKPSTPFQWVRWTVSVRATTD
jgi:DMSO/TMAO reductase YedYZ molybdopterin-dependent catalytic subunit